MSITQHLARSTDFSREPFYSVELDLEKCQLEYGVPPCTAEIGVTGDDKCFNTTRTCQDRLNLDLDVITYEFTSSRSPLPEGVFATDRPMPTMKGSPKFDAAKVDISGGTTGIRAQVKIEFIDSPDSDRGTDPYVEERDYNPLEQGTFWTKFLARNPFYIGRALRVYSGWLDNGVYDKSNFTQREYIIETIDVVRGGATVTAKDPLKLADNDRAQYPAKTNGDLSADIDDVVTSLTIIMPPGEDVEDQYPASGYLTIGPEAMTFTRVGLVFTVVRGFRNTVSIEHSEGDAVQNSVVLNDRVDLIVNEILTLGADVPPEFIPLAEWEAEALAFYPTFLDGYLPEPVGVTDLLKELGESAPHYLYWDDRVSHIKFVAIKPPADEYPLLNDDENLLPGIKLKELPDMRISDVQVNFGMFNPTVALDEDFNYRLSYRRLNIARETAAEFGRKALKVVNSRWIGFGNRQAAEKLAQAYGRRFGLAPTQINFSLDHKDDNVWVGSSVDIITRDKVDFLGNRARTAYQITSVKETADAMVYEALEYSYDGQLPSDTDPNVRIIDVPTGFNQNLRALHDLVFGSVDNTNVIRFNIGPGFEAGSADTATPAVDTGTWPLGIAPIELVVSGRLQGAGGNGGQHSGPRDGQPGGLALEMNIDVLLVSLDGVLASGAGGGGMGRSTSNNGRGGGGGAGIIGGPGGTNEGSSAIAQSGTKDEGGQGTLASNGRGGGTGGGPGLMGLTGTGGPGNVNPGGAPGNAIEQNGWALTGDAETLDKILGPIVP